MQNFEKCTVAMLGGPCSQHVTGNTSRQNQPQSAIIQHSLQNVAHYTGHRVVLAYAVICSYQMAMNWTEETQIFHWIWFKMGNGPLYCKKNGAISGFVMTRAPFTTME